MDKVDNPSNQTKPARTILVTGSGGQLGSELRKIAPGYPEFAFIFTSHHDLPVENPEALSKFFSDQRIDYCVNCAAYTAVDKAESEPEKAFLINATAPGLLARECMKLQAKFIHISTDYVYDGSIRRPLREDDPVGTMNVYGASKLKGEQEVVRLNLDALIIRTSWVYSSFGNNFVKTMLRLFGEKEALNVINDQTGCPTYAGDLAEFIMAFVEFFERGNHFKGIVNFCNSGETTWYDFARTIQEFAPKTACVIHPVPTSQYPTPARRPGYSVLDTSKIQGLLGMEIHFWKDSLQKCLKALHVI